MSNRNDETIFWFGFIVVAAVFLGLYLFLKKVGAVIGLPLGPTVWLLIGIAGFVGGLFYVWVTSRRVGAWIWWLVAGTFPFITPALDYWSLDTVSKMIVDSTWEHGELERAWYGNGWVQVLMFMILCGIAVIMHRRDRYY